jgi:hypothetical protein
MNISYFKRFRMEIDLDDLPPVPPLPAGYRWLPWDDALLEDHALVKFSCFQDEIDAIVFASLGTLDGCRRLMQEIRGRGGFVPEATWLVACAGEPCGTVQGVTDRMMGAVQNLGVTPPHRGRGIGAALMVQALHGFRRHGLGRTYLEVTATNAAALRLYRRLGFRCRKTVYKAVPAEPVAS